MSLHPFLSPSEDKISQFHINHQVELVPTCQKQNDWMKSYWNRATLFKILSQKIIDEVFQQTKTIPIYELPNNTKTLANQTVIHSFF